jgi:hypothetical protein
VNQLAATMQQALKTLIPEIEVTGLVSANPACGKAFGVALPDVDMVASVSPQILASILHRGRNSEYDSADEKKLQKAALRVMTDKLITAGFRFRRSGFKGQEPKVTLLAPASLSISGESIPVDFSINAVTPLYNAALLSECGQIDIRARDLILLVKRWAKDRGICHTPKGHLSPYMWGLLTMYFLQVRENDEGRLLPPLDHFEISLGLAGKPRDTTKSKWKRAQSTAPEQSVGDLFKSFMKFYLDEFDWCKEAVSIRLGKRAPPGIQLPLHVVVSEDSKSSQVGPRIEDPFQPSQDLGDCMTAVSLARLKGELSRACQLCGRGASLSELLEPWVPPSPEVEQRSED